MTLLFLDEIQECPKAITALRYFYEKLPELHVIGAGSLIDFVLRAEDFRMPVGRVQSMVMYPMSFGEFLMAVGEERLLNHTRKVDLKTGIEPVFLTRLEQLFRQYLLVGGMPGVVNAFRKTVQMDELQRLQSGLVRTYTDDFAKYASTAKHKYLKEVYVSAPKMVGRRYKYSHVNPNFVDSVDNGQPDKTIGSKLYKHSGLNGGRHCRSYKEVGRLSKNIELPTSNFQH